MVLTEEVLPCMLHMSMRVLEKFVKLLLQEGLNYNVQMSMRVDFAYSIEVRVNTNIFGSVEGRVGQWIFPVSIEDPNAIVDLNFKGNQASNVLENYDHLVNLFYSCYNSREHWNWILNHHKEGCAIVKKENIFLQKI